MKINFSEIVNKLEFVKTLLLAFILAITVRSFFFEPFHIPSSSMKPNLLIGDYIFVSKYSYGYSRYSFPLGLDLFKGRIFQKAKPKRGDVAVFRLPSDTRINYIKRIIGLPGDKVQVRDGVLYINEEEVEKISDGLFRENGLEVSQFIEMLKTKDGTKKEVKVLDQMDSPQDNTFVFNVPEGHYFVMGDNRDNSQDSRFFGAVGYVPEENIVGSAKIIFFSIKEPIWKFWKLHETIRFDRLFLKIK